MRVTNSMLVSSFLADLSTNLSKLSKIEGQMATNRVYAHVSDDPIAVIYSQQARHRLSRVQTYQQNLSTASSWLETAETGLMELNDLIGKAHVSCVQAATDINNESDLQNIGAYMKELRDQSLAALNTAFGTRYVFGGYNTTGLDTADNGSLQAPFTIASEDKEIYDSNGTLILSIAKGSLLFNGVPIEETLEGGSYERFSQETLTFNLGAGVNMPININGVSIAVVGTKTLSDGTEVPETIYSILNDVCNILDGDYTNVETAGTDGSPSALLNKYIGKLLDAQDKVMGNVADVGGAINRIELMTSRYEQDEINYTQMLSDAEDADEAEVIMKFKMAEAVYNASLAAGAQIIQPTLMDYLS